jgi:hypothetical protein
MHFTWQIDKYYFLNTKIGEYYIDSKFKRKEKIELLTNCPKNESFGVSCVEICHLPGVLHKHFRNISKSPHSKTCSKNIFLL